ncbi:MAG: MFS transporter [Erysipelotrichaceae bacterium]|nr:MFS transporter [Erysipelotrichaceae bacterium]
MKGLFKKLNESKIFKDLSPQEFAWVLYDVGNSAFTMLGCSLIPIWFKSLAIGDAPGQISGDNATAYWALATSIVTVIVALIGPFFGAIADHKDTKKIFFTTAVAGGVIGCIINGFAMNWLLFLIIYILAKIFYQISLTFYDSMLNDVTSDERSDAVSAYGYAWGYIGSCLPFTVALIAYVLGPDMVGLISGGLSRMIGFGVTAVWWWLVTVPLLSNYKQINYSSDQKGAVARAFSKIFKTVKKIAAEDKKVLYFLIAFFLYIDGVGTIIDNCINIGTDLGLNTVGQVIFLLLTQVVAWLGSLVFARLSKKKDTVFLIQICILGYTAVCLYALTLTKLWQFAIMAFGVGCFQGSIQSLSRSYYAKIIPDENSGEYFGIYDIFAKGASFLGSFLIYVVKKIGIRTGGIFTIFGSHIKSINVAIGLLALFFLLGIIFIRMADKAPQSEESKKDIQE